MKSALILLLITFSACLCLGQSIEVSYDKKGDFTKYKTFSLGASQISTPSDQKQVPDATLNGWIVNGITNMLKLKGLVRRDSLPDLIVTYLVGTFSKTDNQTFGMQLLPGGRIDDRKFEYRQTSFIIDLNDRKDNLIWRVNSTTNMTSTEAEQTINAIIQAGFKKFARSSKKKKK